MSSVAVEESVTLTGSPLYRLKHKWTVKEFAATYLGKSTDKKDYPRFYSSRFSSSLDRQTDFRLVLQPRGPKEKSHHYLGLYLEMERSRASLLVKSADLNFKFSLLNARNEKCHSKEFRREFMYPFDTCGWSTHLKHSELQDPAKGLLPSDTLTILAEVDVYQVHMVNLEQASLLTKLKVETLESLTASHGDLLESGDHSDVILVVEGGEIAAHKAFLSAGSPVFRAMFKPGTKEEMEGKVIIPDLEEHVARELLEFIYTGETDYLADYPEELLAAADKYGVTRLKEQCAEYLCGQVDTENAANLFALADRHSVAKLKTVCMEYIRAHWEDVMLTEDWPEVSDLFWADLRQLKLKEKEVTEKEKEKPQEESESTMVLSCN